MHVSDLIEEVIGVGFKVHNTLDSGFLEKVYEKSMLIEFRKRGIVAERQRKLQVFYEGHKVGDFYADIVVENKLILELKVVQSLSVAHERQLVNYLVATGIDDGLLINFGQSVEVKRKYRIYTPKK
ncbi:MAG: GxxExxY protein [Bacteroidales bacterium]|jgi:GxxExxY protein|nr:GxxExxY protein [Bacteroidales bacterium]